MPEKGPLVTALLQEILGCQWGRQIGTVDDDELCFEQAADIVVIHHGDEQRFFKLCAAHRDRVLSETTPHVS